MIDTERMDSEKELKQRSLLISGKQLKKLIRNSSIFHIRYYGRQIV